MNDLKAGIKDILLSFDRGNLSENALALFRTLGYATDRQSPFAEKTFKSFKEAYLEAQSAFREEKALVKDWKYVDLLFQLSGAEIVFGAENQGALIKKEVNTSGDSKTVIESYLFFAIELSREQYTRTALSQITREVNKVFPMPVMILFKHGKTLSISVINRRINIRDERKDVLRKVTLIKDISIAQPHRAHIEILSDLSLGELRLKHKFSNFVGLHCAWQKTLDTKELNRQFYSKLFNWYLWALTTVKFPQIRPAEDMVEDNVHQSESLIRLLTRLLFCWFMKEKGLINEKLFNVEALNEMLKGFNGPVGEETIYYKAILQNLFFATLSKPVADRKLIKNIYPNPAYGDSLVYRYPELFKKEADILKHFENIPFLNGGLFDCLDSRKNEHNPVEIRLDGFSTKKSKQPIVPDKLFFGEYTDVDLSGEYDDTKKSNVTVYGLIDILNHYKFTIEENTPVEEEVALDPELLGKVFENLLASYNPETHATARNQTGSFYTPREIVNYMVDESLKAYLKQKLAESNTMKPEDAEVALGFLFEYSEKEHLFDKKQAAVLIAAIDSCKVLDPACGSGAFPMGILQKLIHILRKIDPENRQWFEIVISKFPASAQSAIRNKLEKENWDYVRKLGIIQECIYGVDIQPIAIQISKLRFFITLLVDQNEKPGAVNRGFEALPNLDFKLVAADTLIGVPDADIIDTDLFADNFFNEFDKLAGQYFGVNAPEAKKKLKEKITGLITAKCDDKVKNINNLSGSHEAGLSRILAEKHKDRIEEKQREVKLWNSYKNLFKQEAVGFFEPKYFFPKAAGGFDVVIGNPPYVQIQNFSGMPQQKDWERQKYETYARTGDVYCLFYERGYRLLREGGTLAFITSNKWMRANYGRAMRRFLAEKTNPVKLVDFENYSVFESATVNTNILVFTKAHNNNVLNAVSIKGNFKESIGIDEYLKDKGVILESLNEDSWLISSNDEYALKKRIEEAGVPLKNWDIAINYGIKTGLNEAFIIDGKKKDELIAKDSKSAEIIKPILLGRDIKRYKIEFADLWLIFIPWHFPLHEEQSISGVSDKAEKIFNKNYPAIFNHLAEHKDALVSRNLSETGIRYEWYALQRCAASYFREFDKPKITWGNLALSAQFAIAETGFLINAPSTMITPANKYLLAVLNSHVGDYYIRSLGVTRSGGYFEYKPMFVENLPVPKISPKKQLPFEILVDCILFCKERDLKQESDLLESVVDGLVYDLYFPKEMKSAHCYITDRISEIIKPFKKSDTIVFKTEYITKLCEFCRKDTIIFHCLIHRRTVKPVQIVAGGTQ